MHAVLVSNTTASAGLMRTHSESTVPCKLGNHDPFKPSNMLARRPLQHDFRAHCICAALIVQFVHVLQVHIDNFAHDVQPTCHADARPSCFVMLNSFCESRNISLVSQTTQLVQVKQHSFCALRNTTRKYICLMLQTKLCMLLAFLNHTAGEGPSLIRSSMQHDCFGPFHALTSPCLFDPASFLAAGHLHAPYPESLVPPWLKCFFV